jgi:hypothetical protein
VLEQIDDDQVENVVQLVEITNNVDTTAPLSTAPSIEPQVASTSVNDVVVEVEPLSDSNDPLDVQSAPSAGSADADSAAEPVVTATIPAALVAEGTEVTLSLQDSFQVQDAPSTEVASASDPAGGFSNPAPDVAAEAVGTTEESAPNTPEPDAAEAATDEVAAVEADPEATADGDDSAAAQDADADADADADDDVTDESVAETDEDSTDAEATAEDSAPATTDTTTEQTPLAVAVTEVDSNQASQTVSTADAQATDRTVEELGLPDLVGQQTPSPQVIGDALTNIRQQVLNAIRGGGNQP